MAEGKAVSGPRPEGLTLLEVVIGLGILGLIILAVAAFQKDFYQLNRLVSGGLSRENDLRRVLKNFGAEVKSASPSSTGSYLIETAAGNSFVFFADIDNDGLKERIRYFRDGAILKKGFTKPGGNPIVYNLANELVSSVIPDVTGPAAIFSYFDAAYDGATNPLTEPVNVAAVRLVRLTLVVDPNGSRPPAPSTFTMQATFRNLRSQ